MCQNMTNFRNSNIPITHLFHMVDTPINNGDECIEGGWFSPEYCTDRLASHLENEQ